MSGLGFLVVVVHKALSLLIGELEVAESVSWFNATPPITGAIARCGLGVPRRVRPRPFCEQQSCVGLILPVLLA